MWENTVKTIFFPFQGTLISDISESASRWRQMLRHNPLGGRRERLPADLYRLRQTCLSSTSGRGPREESRVPSPGATEFSWLQAQTVPLWILFSETKKTPTSPHSQRVENSGWRQGRHVRPRHTGSCCRWPRPLLLSSWTWARTCSTCWCVDQNTPPTSDTSSHLARLQHTV